MFIYDEEDTWVEEDDDDWDDDDDDWQSDRVLVENIRYSLNVLPDIKSG